MGGLQIGDLQAIKARNKYAKEDNKYCWNRTGKCFCNRLFSQKKNFVINVFDVDQINNQYNQEKSLKLKTINSGKDFGVDTTRSFSFGGTSNLWHGVITKFDEIDWKNMFPNNYEIQDEIKEIYNELIPWYSELKKPEEKNIPSFFRSPFIKDKESRLEDKDLYIMHEPLRTKSILKDLDEKGLINLYQNSVAISLEDGENDQENAHFLNYYQGGRLRKIYGDVFIISCGALETPRLILQSCNDEKFSYENNSLGTNLIDHPWTVIGEISSKRPLVTNHFYINSSELSYRRGHNIQIDSNKNIKNHCVMYRPYQFGNIMNIKDILTELLISRSLITWISLFKKFKSIDILSTVIYMISEKYNLSFLNYKCAIYFYMDQESTTKSNITLSKQKDDFGRIIPIINWDHGLVEQEEIKQVDKILKEEFKNDEHFNYSSTKELWDKLSSGSHHAGTMRIGMNDRGVIDKDLKLNNKGNVFICDLSIFPRFGNSNPTYTLSAFSRRLGKHIYKNF